MATANSINANSTGIAKYDGAGTWSAITVTNHSVLVGAASNGITSIALTDGQLLIGSTGADPVAATLSAGTNVTITNAAGSITIAASGGGGGGMTWTEVTGTSQTAAVNNGYICNNAGLVTVTLPSTYAVGDIVAVVGKGAGLWKVAANAGDTIHFGNQDSTSGGSITGTNRYDAFEVIGTVANTEWTCTGRSQGNLTVA